MSALLRPEEPEFSVEEHDFAEGLGYLHTLVEQRIGVVRFETGTGRIVEELRSRLPSFADFEDQKEELCQQIADFVYPLAADLSAQAVAITLTISPKTITPPTSVPFLATFTAFDVEHGLVRHIYLSPRHNIPDVELLSIPAGLAVECMPLNYHQSHEDRGTRPQHAGSALPNRDWPNRNVDAPVKEEDLPVEIKPAVRNWLPEPKLPEVRTGAPRGKIPNNEEPGIELSGERFLVADVVKAAAVPAQTAQTPTQSMLRPTAMATLASAIRQAEIMAMPPRPAAPIEPQAEIHPTGFVPVHPIAALQDAAQRLRTAELQSPAPAVEHPAEIQQPQTETHVHAAQHESAEHRIETSSPQQSPAEISAPAIVETEVLAPQASAPSPVEREIKLAEQQNLAPLHEPSAAHVAQHDVAAQEYAAQYNPIYSHDSETGMVATAEMPASETSPAPAAEDRYLIPQVAGAHGVSHAPAYIRLAGLTTHQHVYGGLESEGRYTPPAKPAVIAVAEPQAEVNIYTMPETSPVPEVQQQAAPQHKTTLHAGFGVPSPMPAWFRATEKA